MPSETDEIHHHVFRPAPALARSRYNRQLLIPSISLQGQERIASSHILIIGLGGLGSPASLYLAGAGVHTLGLLDHDVVEESNLHRQIVHRESSVHPNGTSTSASVTNISSAATSMTKVQSALRGCRELNPTINYRTHEVQLDGSNALDIIRDYDIVLDCTDNPATRYLISDVCVILDKILVSGAAQRLDGQLMVLNYLASPPGATDRTIAAENAVRDVSKGPCYRCVFPVPPSPDMVQGCSEIGILGPVVGTIGCLMASETLRLICSPDEVRKPTMLLYNAWSVDPKGTFRTIGLRGKRQDCLSCGDAQVLAETGKKKLDAGQINKGIMDYNAFCGVVEEINILRKEERVRADDFLQTLRETRKHAIVVDVREEVEVELGPKIDGSINIPISHILRAGTTNGHGQAGRQETAAWQTLLESSNEMPIYFICQRGNDSQIAAQMLIARSQQEEKSRWIGDVEGGFIAIERHASKQ